MALKKTPTLSARVVAATAATSAALATFEKAAADLDASASVSSDLAVEARDEAARLIAVSDAALADAERAARAAEKVRDLIA